MSRRSSPTASMFRRESHLDVAPSPHATARFVASISGAARDTVTDRRQRQTGTEATITLTVDPDGAIDQVQSTPHLDQLDTMLGAQLGRGFRAAIAPALAGAWGSPLHLLLNDLPSCPAGMRNGLTRQALARGFERAAPSMASPCLGWRKDGHAYAVRAQGLPPPLRPAPPSPPSHTDLPVLPIGHGRRRRRIDAWLADDALQTRSLFRDSHIDLEGVERTVHEYAIDATFDPSTGRLRALHVDPRVLPFDECPLASQHVAGFIGRSPQELDLEAQTIVAPELACTHLNDCVRMAASFVGQVLKHHLWQG